MKLTSKWRQIHASVTYAAVAESTAFISASADGRIVPGRVRTFTFLECAVAGTFGGWQEGDTTGRIPLPGGVALLGPDGSLIDTDAQADEDSVGAIHPMNWRVLHTFLEMGQYYE
ncbi:MAG: hypothetical protein AAF645_04690 [Myxococcota bacterium]